MDPTGGQLGQAQTGRLQALAGLSAQKRLILLAPGADVLVTSITVPVKSSGKMLQAIPFALEEHLVGDIETQHFAISKRDNDGTVGVAVIDKDRLQSILDQLKEHGLEPDEVIPESLGLPWTIGQTSLLLREDGVSALRTGQWDSVFLPSLPVEDALVFAAGEESVNTLTIYCDSGIAETVSELQDNCEIQLLKNGDLPLLASQVIGGPSINFLQGAFAPRSQIKEKFRPWRFAASLLLALLLTVLARDVVRLQQIKSIRESLDGQMADILRATCPDQSRIVNPLNQLLACTGSGRGSAEPQYFLDALTVVSSAIPDNRNVKIVSVNFAERAMELRLNVPDIATLDNIQKKVSESVDFTAEIQSTSQDENRVEGRIQIRKNEDQA